MRVPLHLAYLSPILYGIWCSSMPTDHGSYRLVSDHSSLAPNDSLAYGPQPRADGTMALPLLKRTLMEDNCDGDAQIKMNNGYWESVDALSVAIQRTEELLSWLARFPDEAPAKLPLRSALFTFEVIFGKVYGSHGQIQAGIDTVKHVLDDAKAILATIKPDNRNAPPKFDWWCSNEAWLEPLGGKRYIDKYSPRGQGQHEIELDHVCDDNSGGLVAFMTHYEDLIDTPNAIDRLTFCPKALENFDWPLHNIREATLTHEQVHIDELQEHTVGMNFLHELGHLQIAMGIDGAYADVPWAGGPNGRAYGWKAVRGVSPALAEQNADNFAYWVVAMFLDKYDWHTGYSIEHSRMPPYGGHMGN